MNTYLSVAVCGLLVVICSECTQATSCYVCSSLTNSACGEKNFNYVTNILNVQEDCDYCTKEVVRAAGSDVTSRGCSPICTPVAIGAFGIGTEMACCNSLLCNGATTIGSLGFLVAIMTSLIHFLF